MALARAVRRQRFVLRSGRYRIPVPGLIMGTIHRYEMQLEKDLKQLLDPERLGTRPDILHPLTMKASYLMRNTPPTQASII